MWEATSNEKFSNRTTGILPGYILALVFFLGHNMDMFIESFVYPKCSVENMFLAKHLKTAVLSHDLKN